MRKPRNMWELSGWLFLFLGAIFLICGMLSWVGVLKTNPNSHGDPGVVFPIVGCVWLLIGIVSILAAILKEKRRTQLFETGVPVTGKIDAITQLPFTRWGTSYPYVVYFTYELDGVQYKGKRGLFWTLPLTKVDDNETVFIDVDNPRHCALKLKSKDNY